MSEFIESLVKLLQERSEGIMDVAHTNIRLGKVLHARYNGAGGEGEEKLSGLAIALAKKGCPVPPDFLAQVYRVYQAVGGERGFERLKARRRRLSWSGLVREFSRPPLGNTKEAVSFWAAFMKEIENTQERVDVLIEHFGSLPDELKPEAEGLLLSMGYSINSFPPGAPPDAAAGPSDGLVVRSRTYRGSARKLRILHLADEHFRDRDLEEIRKSAAFIVRKAQYGMPHLIISAGDLLDERQFYDTPAFREAVSFIKSLADIAPVLILQGTSDHDGFTMEVFSRIGARHPVLVMDAIGGVGLREGEFTSVEEVDTLDALLYAIPPLSKARLLSRAQHPLPGQDQGDRADACDRLGDTLALWGGLSAAAREAGIPVVLAGHLAVRGSVTSTGRCMRGKAIEVGAEDLRRAGADLIVLGHIHKMQHRDGLFYAGSITRLDYGEEEDKGFWMHEFSPEGLLSHFTRIPTRPRMTFEFDAQPDLSLLPAALPNGRVRIRYRVRQEEVASLDEKAIERELRRRGALEVKFERSVIPQYRVRAAGISQARTLEEKLRKYAELNGLDLTEGILAKAAELGESVDTGVVEEAAAAPTSAGSPGEEE
ncbi:MAG: metallophosphoesterase [Thermodesulfovibrionales bacterium]